MKFGVYAPAIRAAVLTHYALQSHSSIFNPLKPQGFTLTHTNNNTHTNNHFIIFFFPKVGLYSVLPARIYTDLCSALLKGLKVHC